MKAEDLYERFKAMFGKLKSINWRDPKIALGLAALLVLPFVAKHYVMTGILIGCLMAMAIVWLIQKGPRFVRFLSQKHPLAADIVFSSIALLMFGSYFGGGLMLGIAAIICALVLSLILPGIEVDPKVATA